MNIIKKANFNEFREENKIDIDNTKSNLNILNEITTKVDINLGESILKLSDIKNFKPGYLFSINKLSTEMNVDISIQNNKIATGEIVIIDGEAFVKIIDITEKNKT